MLQDCGLLNVEPYILYEICLVLEEAYKKKIATGKIKNKMIKYLESNNRLDSAKNLKKIKIY